MAWGAGAYIVGEETALIESLEGERGMPRLKPPYFPAAKGLYMAPTIVNNVETLSNLPWLITHGTEAYRAVGTETSPGTRLIALSGHVNRPGIYEVAQGTTTFRDLFYGEDYGQGIRDGNQLKMFIPGGGSAPWFYPEQVGMALEGKVPSAAPGRCWARVRVVVMDDTTDAVAACLRLVRFYARESCGKCTPCREGTTWLERILRRIIEGYGRPSDIGPARATVGDNISAGPLPQCRMGGGGPGGHPVPARDRPPSAPWVPLRWPRSPRRSAASGRSSRPTSRRPRTTVPA
jgi:NADH-quinone oxidoreductase subunit F